MGLAGDSADKPWVKAFDKDIELMGRILRDVLKAEQAVPGRPGPRPALNGARAQPMVDEWMDRDPKSRPYNLRPFADALRLLMQGHTMAQVVRKTGISHAQMTRLLLGQREPTAEVIEKVAAAFDKKPSYFLEYRIGIIAAAIVFKLSRSPEKTVSTFESLFWEQNEEPHGDQ